MNVSRCGDVQCMRRLRIMMGCGKLPRYNLKRAGPSIFGHGPTARVRICLARPRLSETLQHRGPQPCGNTRHRSDIVRVGGNDPLHQGAQEKPWQSLESAIHPNLTADQPRSVPRRAASPPVLHFNPGSRVSAQKPSTSMPVEPTVPRKLGSMAAKKLVKV